MPPLWRVDGVVVKGATRPRLSCDGLQIQPGITAVLGESGAGKSTLLNLLVGFDRPDAGTLRAVLPADPARLELFWAPQNEGLWPHLTGAEHVSTVRGSTTESTAALLQSMELDGLEARHVADLSVGEQSRLAIARAVAADAAVTVLDEPFAHVDRARRGLLWQRVVARAKSTSSSLVFATHSPRMVLGYAARVVLLRDGAVIAEGAVDALYWHPATPAIAEALGPVNWLAAGEAAVWLPGGAEDRNYRPCELQLEAADADAPLRVEREQFGGEVSEVTLVHVASGRQRCFHLLPGIQLPSGSPVRLSVRPCREAGGVA
jgi:iron(III) transport system ATP-binding protein